MSLSLSHHPPGRLAAAQAERGGSGGAGSLRARLEAAVAVAEGQVARGGAGTRQGGR